MKSYIQGLFTGGVLVLAFMVLIGAQNQEDNSNDILDDEKRWVQIETRLKTLEGFPKLEIQLAEAMIGLNQSIEMGLERKIEDIIFQMRMLHRDNEFDRSFQDMYWKD